MNKEKDLKINVFFVLFFVVRQPVANQQFCLPVPQLLISVTLVFYSLKKEILFCSFLVVLFFEFDMLIFFF